MIDIPMSEDLLLVSWKKLGELEFDCLPGFGGISSHQFLIFDTAREIHTTLFNLHLYFLTYCKMKTHLW